MKVQIPGKAINAEGDDLEKPTTDLLRSLSMLPSEQPGKLEFLTGPPDSVAIIEAGATAASKWWSTAIAGGAVVFSVRIASTWDSLGGGGPWNQPFALLAVGLILAAAALGIAYLLSADVSGRAAGMVATIEARRDVAIAMTRQAGLARPNGETPSPAPAPCYPIPLAALGATNGTKIGAAEAGWRAIATRDRDGKTEFLLIKASEAEWVAVEQVVFA